MFKNKPLNLDRTRLFYHLFVDCRDGEATVKMTRIVYLYDEERDPQTYYANEWITDRYGLNKKKTKPVFNCKAYTVTGEIRGEWDTYNRTVDVLLNDAEVKQITKLVAEAGDGDFLYILEDKMPKLYDLLDDYFRNLAWKQVVKDGMDYYNLSRREAEDADMTGYEYQVYVPKEFKEQ